MISVVFTDFDAVAQIKKYRSRYQLREIDEGVVFSKHMEIHIVDLSKYSKRAQEAHATLEQWVSFLKKETDMTQETIDKWHSPEHQKAWQELQSISQNPDMRLVYESRYKAFMDEQDRLFLAKETAKAEGRAEGKAEGLEEGERAKALKIARKMLQKGLPTEEVAELSELPLEQVEAIAASLDKTEDNTL